MCCCDNNLKRIQDANHSIFHLNPQLQFQPIVLFNAINLPTFVTVTSNVKISNLFVGLCQLPMLQIISFDQFVKKYKKNRHMSCKKHFYFSRMGGPTFFCTRCNLWPLRWWKPDPKWKMLESFVRVGRHLKIFNGASKYQLVEFDQSWIGHARVCNRRSKAH